VQATSDSDYPRAMTYRCAWALLALGTCGLLSLACSKSSNDVALPEPPSSLPHATAIPYEMPKATSSGNEVLSTDSIRITAAGALFVDERPTNDADLVDRLRASAASASAQASRHFVVINADAEAPYGVVIHVVDAVETAGAGPVVFSVSRSGPGIPPPPPPPLPPARGAR